VHRIVDELEATGYLVRERRGRRNHHTVRPHLPLSDPLARGQKVGDPLEVLTGGGNEKARDRGPSR
jgi:hypothetical protein